jgi:hypothetical protein
MTRANLRVLCIVFGLTPKLPWPKTSPLLSFRLCLAPVAVSAVSSCSKRSLLNACLGGFRHGDLSRCFSGALPSGRFGWHAMVISSTTNAGRVPRLRAPCGLVLKTTGGQLGFICRNASLRRKPRVLRHWITSWLFGHLTSISIARLKTGSSGTSSLSILGGGPLRCREWLCYVTYLFCN